MNIACSNSCNEIQHLSDSNDFETYKKGSEIINLIIFQNEHETDFLELLHSKIEDQYLNTIVYCFYTKFDKYFLEQIKLLENRFPNFKAIKIIEEWSGSKIGNIIQENIVGNNIFWVKGNQSVFNKVDNLKKFNIRKYEQVFDYLENKKQEITNRVPYPNFISIMLTQKCNYSCFFCRDNNHNMPQLTLKEFYSLKPIIENAKILDITGWGEPLSYKYINEALSFIIEHGNKDSIQITTNASLLTEGLAEKLSNNLHKMVISINAATKATYERDMRNGKWEKVISNIKNARKFIPKEKIVLSFVGHRDNIEEFPLLVKLAAELDIGEVSLTHLIITIPENVKKSLWFYKEQTNKAVYEARLLGRNLNILVGGRNFLDPVPSNNQMRCNFPYTETYWAINGDVSPCCFSEGNAMGNTFVTGSFDEIWNGKKYNRLRKERYFPECKTCMVVSDPNYFKTHLRTFTFSKVFNIVAKISIVVDISEKEQIDNINNIIVLLNKQTYPVWELIIVANRDYGTEIEKFKNKQISIVFSDNPNLFLRLNEGINLATGEYICFLMSEQKFKNIKLEQHLKMFEQLDNDIAVIVESKINSNDFIDANLFTSISRTEILQELGGLNPSAKSPLKDLIRRLYDKGFKDNIINETTTLNLDEILINESETLIKQQKVDEAISKLQEAIEINPNSIEAHIKLGLIYSDSGDYNKLLVHFERVIEINPNFRIAVINIGKIYKALGNMEKARLTYSKYLKNNPNDEEIKNLLSDFLSK